MTITRRRLSIGLAGGAAAAMIPLAVVYACTAQVAISTTTSDGLVNKGAPGNTITVTLAWVYQGGHVVVDLNSQYVYSGIAPGTSPKNETGMSFTMTVPNWAPGEYYFTTTVVGGPKMLTYTSTGQVFQILAPSSTSQYRSSGPTGSRQGTTQVANGQPNAAAGGSALAGTGAGGAAPQLSSAIAVRIAARDGAGQASPPSPASRASQLGATVAFAPETGGQGNPMLTALIVGVVTLAVGLPLLVMGFATVTALQRRATRTNARNDSHRDRERLS